MTDRIEAFWQDMKKKQVSVVGIGVSHRDLLFLFAEKGIAVTAYDRRTRDELGELAGRLEAAGVKLVLGSGYLRELSGDVILRTPGMNFLTPELTAARGSGAAVTSEMELFFDLCPCKIIGVTGSDGKTTTTTLIAEMLKADGKTVHLGGNIGRALLPEIEQIAPDDYAVVELSSFQLISMRRSPDIAVVTNVEPNHLDVHKNMEEYIEAKANILAHQNAFGKAVLNQDNRTAFALSNRVRGDRNTFSRRVLVNRGAWADSNLNIWYSDNGSQTKVLEGGEIRLPGLHNVENYLAAISAVWGLVSPESIRKVAREFGGVEHRIEFVRELDGVKWYNDSIATSPTRTIAGLRSFDQKLIIIAGGYDKKIPFEPLAPVLLERVKTLILTGVTAKKIEAAVVAAPGFAESGLRILHAENLEDAVRQARGEAQPGDIVSLSPACASFDCYPNFEARGKHFKELVAALV